MSLKCKMIISTITVFVIMVALIVAFVNWSAQELRDTLSEERLITVSQAAYAYMRRLEENNRMTTRAMADSQTLLEYVQNWNHYINREDSRLALLRYLNGRKSDMGLDSFVVTDRYGYVILRTHDLETYGDVGLVAPNIAAAVERGQISTVFSATPTLTMGLASAAPIWESGEIAGSIVGINDIASPAFVDSFARVFNAAVTVFQGYTAVMSTLELSPGVRAIGTEAAPYVRETVINQGRHLDTELVLFGTPHHAFYFPLMGWGGTPVGMFFVGFSTEAAVTAANNMRRNLIIIGAVSLLASTLFIWMIKKCEPL